MTLQEQFRSDLKKSMKAKNAAKTSTIRIVLGEFSRQTKKDLTDQEVIAVIRKLVKSENETLSQAKESSSEYLEILESYLPQAPSEQEIKQWIADNIDFESFNNKMQAMKPIMANFGGMADGNVVKKILLDS